MSRIARTKLKKIYKIVQIMVKSRTLINKNTFLSFFFKKNDEKNVENFLTIFCFSKNR